MPSYQAPRQYRPAPPSRPPLAWLWRAFLTGLVVVVPLAVTLYLLLWLFSVADSLFSGMGQALLPDGWYSPGLGLTVVVLIVVAIGAVVNAWAFGRLILGLANRILERIPLIKSVYGGVRDLMLFVSRSPASEKRRVVLVTLPGEMRLIGFITDAEPAQAVPELNRDDGETVVAVYLPMSYQIGGYTLYLPERCLQRLQMPVEEAMRMVLTAGMNRPRAPIPSKNITPDTRCP